jgi:hypothetical protein
MLRKPDWSKLPFFRFLKIYTPLEKAGVHISADETKTNHVAAAKIRSDRIASI